LDIVGVSRLSEKVFFFKVNYSFKLQWPLSLYVKNRVNKGVQFTISEC